MKIRNDFVTNSSSSSFILGFTSSENINEELSRGFPANNSEQFETVLKDVENAEQFDKDEAIKRIREEMKYHARSSVEEVYRRRTGCSYIDAIDYVETEEGKKEVEDYLEKIVSDVVSNMNGKSIFVELSYSDNDGSYYSELEHEIMPDIESTMISMSHH